MALFDRLVGVNKDLATHQFVDGMMMVELGVETLADFKTSFGLTADDDAQLTLLRDAWQSVTADRRYHDLSFRTALEAMLRLAEHEHFDYDNKTTFQTKLNEAITALNAL